MPKTLNEIFNNEIQRKLLKTEVVKAYQLDAPLSLDCTKVGLRLTEKDRPAIEKLVAYITKPDLTSRLVCWHTNMSGAKVEIKKGKAVISW